MQYELQPIELKEAQRFVNEYHRHNVAPHRDKFRIAINDGEKIVGVVMVGRPIARHTDDGWTLLVLRCCVLDDHKNACSKLYAAAWRATRAMGYKRLITYTLLEEAGTSLKAAGWKIIGKTTKRNKGWDTPSRPRKMPDKYPIGQKTIWEVGG